MISAYENSSKEELISTIILLKEELAQIKRMVFGTKSERFVPSVIAGQGALGFDIEMVV
jgi:Transposase C of IS166 homeodomain